MNTEEQTKELPLKRTKPYDEMFKLVLLGDSGVGKSSILVRFTEGCFSESYISTIGVDFKFKIIERDNKSVRLQIWDTAGQERFRTIISSYYRGADAVLLVYDITSKESFDSARDWYEEVLNYVPKNTMFVLLGNKSDLKETKEVSAEIAQEFAEQIHALFSEVSAKNAENIDYIFTTIAHQLLDKKYIGYTSMILSEEESFLNVSKKVRLYERASVMNQKVKRDEKKCC